MVEIVFLTSSKEKIAHARYVFRNYPIEISKQKNYGITYVEPRILDREKLLRMSIEDAKERWKRNASNPDEKFFFIEDTSVIVDALSTDGREYPGVDVKYWMRENTFKDVDFLLKERGNNRKVVVRSDIVLHLPLYYQQKLGREYLIFTSSTEGKITEVEFNVKTHPLYPWLSGSTFNKWFIPKGAEKPISLLPIEEADNYDFRLGAYKEFIEFFRRHLKIKEKTIQPKIYKQASFSFKRSLASFIIVGPTCSGKSTLAEYLLRNYKLNYFEASDFMYLSYYEYHGTSSNVRVGDFAKEILLRKPNIVSEQIIEKIKNTEEIPFVISGFRSPNEIEGFLRKYIGPFDIMVVLISADKNIRYERNLKRGRVDRAKTFEEFERENEKQYQMGLGKIVQEYSQKQILNEGALGDYFKKFEEAFENNLLSLDSECSLSIDPKWKMKSLEDEIILSLFRVRASEKFFTTTKIAHLVNSVFANNESPKNKNNVSRYFNFKFYPYYEVSVKENKTMYRLSQTGIGRAYYLLRLYKG